MCSIASVTQDTQPDSRSLHSVEPLSSPPRTDLPVTRGTLLAVVECTALTGKVGMVLAHLGEEKGVEGKGRGGEGRGGRERIAMRGQGRRG